VTIVKCRQAAAFVFAGGASSRTRQDKGLLDFNGVLLFVHMTRRIEPFLARGTVVLGPRRYWALGLRAIANQDSPVQGSKRIRRGPLAGIAFALAATRFSWNLNIACRLPYLSGAWLNWLLPRAIRSRGQVGLARTACGLEPLAAVYRRECGGPIVTSLAERAKSYRRDRTAWDGRSLPTPMAPARSPRAGLEKYERAWKL
jgi:molybdopterin-guanine dinucleotide biosynthesis protein A